MFAEDLSRLKVNWKVFLLFSEASITTMSLQLFIASTISSDKRVASSTLASSAQTEMSVLRKISTTGMTFSRSDLA
jgi:hypothetical protein